MTGLILKLLFKASIPLVCVAGVMTYGVYLRGGDPMAMYGQLLGGAVQSAKSSAATSLYKAKGSLTSLQPGDTTSDKVYSWTDANGVTHFGSTPPNGISTQSTTYTNRIIDPSESGHPQTAKPAGAPGNAGLDDNGNRLPGVAGMGLPTSANPAALTKFLQTVQQDRQ